jgi:hypothetical protein
VYAIKNGVLEQAYKIVREYDSYDEMNEDIEDMCVKGFEAVVKNLYGNYDWLVVFVTKNAK